jgi:aryl-alcohol dehydrogenase
MKSTAAVAHSPHSPFSIEDVELPDLQDTDVLVRIVAVGICHTDIASRDGQLPAPFPAIFGHEAAGVVERVGDQVRKVVPGDHVVLAPDSDGTCEHCASGEPMYCEHFLELNFQAGTNGRTAQLADGRRASIKYFGQSSFAHYAVAGNRNVVKVRKDLPLKLLGPLGCSMQTGAGTVMNGLRPQPGSSIAVLGVGAVGMAAILGSVVSGCATIIAVDRNDIKLELAHRLGATHAINTTRDHDVGKAIRAVVPRGVNFVVDAAGADPLIAMALAGLARRGTLGLVAVPPSAERTLAVPWAPLLLQGQAVRGFMEGSSIPDVFIPRMIDLYAQGRFPFDKFVRFYPFGEINRAVEDQRNGLAIKPILEVTAA